MTDPVDVLVLGSTGYVAGELLRLLTAHPGLRLRAAFSGSRAGEALESCFPHLAGCYDEVAFAPPESLTDHLERDRPVAVFACLPHGESAVRLDRLIGEAAERRARLRLVDLSADFRHRDAATYQRLYGGSHPAPERLAEFTCGLPDLERETPAGHLAHPGCFATAVTLACAPLNALGLTEPCYRVSAVTGATGAGRAPRESTHLPERASNLFAYAPLTHRHRPEMETLVGRAGGPAPEVLFVPHSGPWSRGIHATVFARLRAPLAAEDLAEHLARFYAHTPFVSVSTDPPRMKDVVGTNRCALAVAVDGEHAVVMSVIDNLTKGAAGGSVQWMNRLCGFEETDGLLLAGPGWS